jgi:hypothetical protein
MLQYATTQCTPLAALSRPVAGVRGQSLVITLPGSPKACVENLTGLLPVLRHAVDLLHSSKSTKILGDVRQMHERMITPFLEACQIVMEAKKPHSGCNCARADDKSTDGSC